MTTFQGHLGARHLDLEDQFLVVEVVQHQALLVIFNVFPLEPVLEVVPVVAKSIYGSLHR